jgi:hypothetical protein
MNDPGPFEARYLAFLETISHLRPRLHRYCARMTGSLTDGEDVVQDALFQASTTAARSRHGSCALRTTGASTSCAHAAYARKPNPKAPARCRSPRQRPSDRRSAAR